ncbi:MAG: PDZ domain-containing protein [Chloroflexi bacterium]|nr:PDZ domain-containing protein [Chloroflexota bacterium]
MTPKSFAEVVIVAGIAVAATLIALASNYEGCTFETWPLRHAPLTVLEQTGAWLTETSDGVLVAYVRCDGPAAQMGLREGDVLVKIDDASSTSTLWYMNGLFSRQRGKKEQMLTISREGAILRLRVPPDLVPFPSNAPNADGFVFGPRSGPGPAGSTSP